jgi:hypothetical protein
MSAGMAAMAMAGREGARTDRQAAKGDRGGESNQCTPDHVFSHHELNKAET